MEHYYVVKSNDILKFADKWVELEKKKHPSEIIQFQKDKHTIYSLKVNVRHKEIQNLRS